MRQDPYTYQVTWSANDGEHVATCLEFPSLSWLAATEVDALRGICDLVRDGIEDLRANDEAVPEPLADRQYSGKFMVRTTPEVHRRLAIEATVAGASLNRYVNAKLQAAG